MIPDLLRPPQANFVPGPLAPPGLNKPHLLPNLSLRSLSLLDKIHTTLNIPTAEHEFNTEELILTIQTLINIQAILNEEIGNRIHLYACGLGLCNT